MATLLVPIPDRYAESFFSSEGSVEFSARYAVGLVPGFRLISPRSGTVTWRNGEEAVLPLTVQLPSDARAGRRTAGSVQFGSEGEAGPQVAVTLDVASAFGFDFDVSTSTISVEPGADLEVEYSLTALGNADDTISVRSEAATGFEPSSATSILHLPAFQSRTGVLLARVAPDAAPGTELYLRIRASSPHAEEKSTVRVFVKEPGGVLPHLAQVPTSVFLGSTVTSVGTEVRADPLVGVAGRGRVARDTELLFSFRSGQSLASSFAFQDVFASPRLQIGVRRPGWHALAGDVDFRTSDLLGYYQPGRGATAAWQRERLSLSMMAARPQTPDGKVLDGEIFTIEGGWGFERLRIGGLLSSTSTTELSGLPGNLTQAGLLRVEGRPAADHLYSVDAGWMRIRDNASGETAEGPAINARYAYRNPGASLDLTFRRRPASAANPRLPPQQFQLSGSARVSPAAAILGGVYDEVIPAGQFVDQSHNNGGYLGVRLGRRALTGELTARVRTRSGTRNGHLGTVRGAVWTRFGLFNVDGSVEIGPQTLDGRSATYRQFRFGASVRKGRTWARLSTRYSSDLNLASLMLYEAYVSHGVGSGLEFFASASAYDGNDELNTSLNVQVGAAFRVMRNTRAYLGVENLSRETAGYSRWRFSAGVQQGLAVPVPLRRPSALEGTVFEDLNANGLLDDGEPTLDGVLLRLGLDETYTRNGGRFEFREELGNTLSIDPLSLGPDYLPPSDIPFQPGQRLDVPVSRAASLQVDVFLDENGNGEWDSSEPPLASAAVAVHSESSTGWRLTTGPDGRLILDAIRPGRYRVSVDRGSLPARAGPVEDAIIEIPGGRRKIVPIPVPIRYIPTAIFGSFEDEADASGSNSGGR